MTTTEKISLALAVLAGLTLLVTSIFSTVSAVLSARAATAAEKSASAAQTSAEAAAESVRQAKRSADAAVESLGVARDQAVAAQRQVELSEEAQDSAIAPTYRLFAENPVDAAWIVEVEVTRAPPGLEVQLEVRGGHCEEGVHGHPDDVVDLPFLREHYPVRGWSDAPVHSKHLLRLQVLGATDYAICNVRVHARQTEGQRSRQWAADLTAEWTASPAPQVF